MIGITAVQVWIFLGELIAMVIGMSLLFAVLTRNRWVSEKLNATPEDYIKVAVGAMLFWLLPLLAVVAIVDSRSFERFLEWLENANPPKFLVS